MQELALVPLATATNVRLMNSALPDSPVVAQRPPGRTRLAAAAALQTAVAAYVVRFCR